MGHANVPHNLKRMAAGCRIFEKFCPDEINWQSMAKRFRLSPSDPLRKNTDRRLGFKIDGQFLVKAYFTFGLRTVAPGRAHLIQTADVPLLAFFVPRKLRSVLQVEEKLLPHNDVHVYDRRILPAGGAYRIPEGETYFLFTTQVAFFGLDLIDAGLDLPFDWQDPTVTKITKLPVLMDRPPQTPYIDEEEREIGFSDVADFFENPPREKDFDFPRPSDFNLPHLNLPQPDLNLPHSNLQHLNLPQPDLNLPQSDSNLQQSDLNLPQSENDLNLPQSHLNLPQSDSNLPQSHSNLQQPDLNLPQPENDSNLPQSHLNLSQPENDSNLPQSNLQQPDLNLPQPDLNLPQPDSNLPQSELNLPQSDSNLPQSHSNLQQPDLNLPQPDSNLPQSDLNLPRSDSNLQQSVVCWFYAPPTENRKICVVAPDFMDHYRRAFEKRPLSDPRLVLESEVRWVCPEEPDWPLDLTCEADVREFFCERVLRAVCEGEMPQDVEMPQENNVEMPQNNFYMPQNNFHVPHENNVYMPQENFYIPQENNVYMPQENNVYMQTLENNFHVPQENNVDLHTLENVCVQNLENNFYVPRDMQTLENNADSQTLVDLQALENDYASGLEDLSVDQLLNMDLDEARISDILNEICASSPFV